MRIASSPSASPSHAVIWDHAARTNFHWSGRRTYCILKIKNWEKRLRPNGENWKPEDAGPSRARLSSSHWGGGTGRGEPAAWERRAGCAGEGAGRALSPEKAACPQLGWEGGAAQGNVTTSRSCCRWQKQSRLYSICAEIGIKEEDLPDTGVCKSPLMWVCFRSRQHLNLLREPSRIDKPVIRLNPW